MINNNMSMIKQLNNIFDYDEYVALCKENNLPSNNLGKYCMGVGILSVALLKYPELSWQDAYNKIIMDMNTKEELDKRDANGCCLKKDSEEKPLGLIDTGKSLIRSTAEHITTGMKVVSDEEYRRRFIDKEP